MSKNAGDEGVGVTSDADVSLSASVVTAGVERRAIRLTLSSQADEPVVARFAHRVPSGRYVETTAATETGRLVGGALEGVVALAPGEEVVAHYFLDADAPGPVSADELPPPDLLSVTPSHSGVALDPTVHWRSADGGRVALALVAASDHPLVTDAEAVPGFVVESWTAERVRRPESRPATGRPAVGVVATREHEDAVYRTILHARDRGFEVYVTPLDDATEVARFAEQLGAHVVGVPADGDVGVEGREDALSAAARAAGHPGVIYQAVSCPRIDYDRTLDAFANAGWEVYAVPEDVARPLDHPRVLAAIPAYRAAESIGDVVREARRYADLVLVVDDGSPDDTAAVASDAGAVVVEHARNKGYGGALKTIFREAAKRGPDYTVTLDADGQHDPADISTLVAEQERTHADVVIGNRYMAADARVPFVRSVGLGVVNLLTNLSMGRFLPEDWIRDTQSGYRAYTLAAVQSLAAARNVGNGMWASTDILYHTDRERFTFAEVATSIRYDLENTSSEGAFQHGFGLVKNIVGVVEHTHPMVLVGLPGMMSVLAGALVGVFSLERFLTTDVLSAPLAITTVLFSIVGVLLLFTAVLIHTINTHPYFRPQD
ncbi:glycosyltransferase family 2 protein [Halocalculus aciditolerans]|uniref:Glycosyltransferase 2-like domain-containing protein n=1 Tax=Halocalculus aciditolerans TaxID=1383812 RepID=A0A830FAH7_9EURY|nr:glycosyltransferase family 2 protein [Halocalculus aciditolerans]GGL55738.1 hypothetical protein GCM10009039_12440 [Halocalculus aciditolerans]